MKAKMKFDQAKIKDFFVAHAEKLVFGAFVVVFLLFAYSAVSKTPYNQTPDSINSLSTQKEQAIAQAAAPPVAVPSAPVAPPPVQAVAYAMTVPIYQPPFDTRNRRMEPAFFTVEELHVSAGFGAIAYPQLVDPNAVTATQPGGPPGLGMGAMGGRFGDGPGKGVGKGPAKGGKGGGESGMPGGPGKGRAAGKGGAAGGDGRFGGGPPLPGGGKGGGGRFGGGEEGGGRFGGMAMGPQAPVVDPDAVIIVNPMVPNGAEVKGKQWAVITGLVPSLKQAREYTKQFSNALQTDPNMDVPHYVGFKIQRAEIKPGTADKELAWQDVDVNKALLEMMEEWGPMANYPEIADPMYVGPFELCQPLPGLVGKNFDKSVTHPRIPLAPVEDYTGAGGMGAMGGGRFGEGGARGGPPGMGMGGMGSKMGGMGGGRFGEGGARSGPPGMGMGGMGNSMGGGRFAPGAMGGGRFGGGAMGGRTGEGGMAGMQTAAPQIQYQLFRFFDFSVTPGKKYRYQVKLVLANPNLGFPANALDAKNPKLAKGETRESPWSAPSATISIPQGSHLLASRLKPARGAVEQKVEVLVRNWNAARAISALQTRDLMRGEAANFSAEAVVDNPMTGQFTKEPDVAFTTNSVLVDMAGGDTFEAGNSKLQAPVEMLVMGPDGDLFVRSQVSDGDELDKGKKEFERRKTLVVEPDPSAGMPAEMPGAEEKGGKGPTKAKGRNPR